MDGDSRDSNRQSTLEGEAKKCNTDCVYFLASPLTCIKGADCEYRHSENARMNPRDCWFWLNGNCLNPKCAFRHPPLDGCRGASGAASSGTFQPSLPPAVPAQLPQYASASFHPQSYASSRQKVPCYYFQRGNCLKGDKCPFMHGPQPPNEPALPQTANATPVSDPQAIKKVANGSEDLSFTQKNLPQTNSVSLGRTSQTVKADSKFGLLPSIKNTVQRNKAPTNGDVDLTGSTNTVSMGRALSRAPLHSQAQDDQLQNGKEVDECLGESPLGFDVLVTDGEEEEEYFDGDSEIAPGHGGMHLSSMRDFDHVGSYTLDEFQGEEGGAYDAYGHTQEQFGWDQHHSPPERLPERMSVTKRILMLREESPDRRGGQDLRQGLSKRRRASGSGGAVSSPNRHADFYRRDGRLREDQYHKHSSQEGLQHPNTESSSKRLRGRIKFPGRPSPDTSSNLYSDFETERLRMRGRFSPSVPGVHQGRHQAIGRMNEDVNFQVKRFKGRNARSQERKTESLDFAGPKRLVELKSAKISEFHEEQTSASANRQAPKSQVAHREERKDMRLGKSSNQDSNGLFSFEGPKPLSDLLKRKREMGLGNNTDSKKRDEFTQGNRNIDVTDSHRIVPQCTELKKDFNEGSHSPISGGTNQGPDSADKAHPFQGGESPVKTGYNVQEEGSLMLDPENPGLEDRESKDAGIGGEENQDMEEEYLDDEDGDDFARKLGVMFT